MKSRAFVVALLICAYFPVVGLAQALHVADLDGRCGYVDEGGNWVIQPQFFDCDGFVDGAARVGLDEGRYAFLNPQGQYLMKPRHFSRLGQLSEGLASFELDDTRPSDVGFIDAHGRVVIPNKFTMAYDFSEGLSAAAVELFKCGYIDKSGKFAISPTFEFTGYQACGTFSEGLAHVVTGGKYGFIDHSGKFVIPATYDEAFDFHDGFAVVRRNGEHGDKYGFIDKYGTVLGDIKFSYAHAFSEGLAGVALDGGWGFINVRGDLVIPAQYEEVGEFSNGLCWVQLNRKFGYIDSSGTLVIQPQYDWAGDFWRGFAYVAQYSKTPDSTVIDKTGRSLLTDRKW
jgi:hypothetical protein